jgi:choice-of-anchor A domain-containing protein
MKVTYGACIGAVALVLTQTAAAAMAGSAGDYNVFIFGTGTFTSQFTDAMGNLAVGGNASLTSYQVAQGIAGDPTKNPNPARLVVGGALTTLNGGSVGSNSNGTIYYGNIAPVLNNNGTFTANGGVVANQTLVDFGSSESFYKSYSQQLGGLAATGQANSAGSTLTLSGANSGLNVFTVSGTTLAQSSSIDISATAGATVLINVTGSAATFHNGSVSYSGGITGAAVLYNFVSATSVQLSPAGDGGFDPEASILAPDAGVTGGFGVMHGQLVADSYSGNTQFDNVAFIGTLPDPVPLPGAVWLLGSGLLGLLGLARRRAT